MLQRILTNTRGGLLWNHEFNIASDGKVVNGYRSTLSFTQLQLDFKIAYIIANMDAKL
jgi:hypothetical protein